MGTKDMSPIEIQGDEAGCCYLAYRAGHTVASFDSIEDARRFAASEELLAACRKAASMIEALMGFYGTGLDVMGWHQNGDGQSWDTFFDDNMDGDELQSLRTAIARATGEPQS